jgi:hypothetical protein
MEVKMENGSEIISYFHFNLVGCIPYHYSGVEENLGTRKKTPTTRPEWVN